MKNKKLKGGKKEKEDLNNKNSNKKDKKEGKMTKKRCPKGSRRSSSGKCKRLPRIKVSRSFKKKRR